MEFEAGLPMLMLTFGTGACFIPFVMYCMNVLSGLCFSLKDEDTADDDNDNGGGG